MVDIPLIEDVRNKKMKKMVSEKIRNHLLFVRALSVITVEYGY